MDSTSMEPDTTLDTTTDPVRLKLRSILRKNRNSSIDMTALLKVRKKIDEKFETMESANKMPILYFNEPLPLEMVVYPKKGGKRRAKNQHHQLERSKVKMRELNCSWESNLRRLTPIPIIEFPDSNPNYTSNRARRSELSNSSLSSIYNSNSFLDSNRIINTVKMGLSNSNKNSNTSLLSSIHNPNESSLYATKQSGSKSVLPTRRTSSNTIRSLSSQTSYHTAYDTSRLNNSRESFDNSRRSEPSSDRRFNPPPITSGAYLTPDGNHQINFDFVQFPYF